MPRDDERAPVYKATAKPAPKTVPAWIRPQAQGPTNIPQGPNPKKKDNRVFDERPQAPDDRQSLPAPAWNTGFNNNFQNNWNEPLPATNISIPNPFVKFMPAWNNLWNPPKQNLAIPPSFAWTQPKPAVIGGYQPQGSAPFWAAINNQRNQELINIAPNIPQPILSAEQAAMRGRSAALQGPIQPPAPTSTGGIRNRGTVRIAKGNPMIGAPSQPNSTASNGGGGTTYKKKKGGGYGGYSYDPKAYADRAPSWLMNLTNWNFKG